MLYESLVDDIKLNGEWPRYHLLKISGQPRRNLSLPRAEFTAFEGDDCKHEEVLRLVLDRYVARSIRDRV